jgi:hypothetical protein
VVEKKTARKWTLEIQKKKSNTAYRVHRTARNEKNMIATWFDEGLAL